MCKIKMLRTVGTTARAYISPSSFHPGCLDLLRTYNDLHAMSTINSSHTRGEHNMALVVQRQVYCSPLPLAVARLQRESLWELHSACGMKMQSARVLRFCIVCAINGRGFAGKFRMCTRTMSLCCTACSDGSIVSIDMIGVVLCVGSSCFYLCPCCVRVCPWRSDGLDLCPLMQCHDSERRSLARSTSIRSDDDCVCYTQGMKDTSAVGHIGSRSSTDPHTGASQSCAVCSGGHVCKNAIVLPDIRSRCMVVVYLCSRHMPHPHAMEYVHDIQDLRSAIHRRIDGKKIRNR